MSTKNISPMPLNLKFIAKTMALLMLVLYSSQNRAVSVSDGVSAINNRNNAEAVKIWTQLANTGNTVAKYNLASHYLTGSGVDKNEQIANQWLKEASRSGFIQAYLNLNKEAIAPANGVTISFIIDPELWLSKQEPSEYTIQLSSSRYEKSIKKIYETNNIKGKGGYFHYVRDGIDRYALIYGSYKTVASANIAIKKLPSNLRKTKPWVRKIKSLQNISK